MNNVEYHDSTSIKPYYQAVFFGEALIRKEIEEIKVQVPNIYPQFAQMFERIRNGERDLYF